MKKTISVITTLVLLAVFTACNGDTLDLDRIEQMLNLPSSLISDDSDDDIGSELDTSTNGTDPADTDDPSNQDQSDPASTANSNTASSNTASRPSQNGSTASSPAQPSNQPNTPPAPPITTPPPAPQPDLPTASPPAAPAPKTAWDYPYDVVAMEAECKAYAESIGLYYMDRESYIRDYFIINPDGTYSPNGNHQDGYYYVHPDEMEEVTKFNGSWFPPEETSRIYPALNGEQLKKRIFDGIYSYRYAETLHFVTSIRVWFEKYEDFVPSGFGELPPEDGPGEYLVFFLWA